MEPELDAVTRFIQTIGEVLDHFDVAVLDQYGVMHDGRAPYPHAVDAIEMLAAAGKEICVVSNSGKRAQLNLDRIDRMGLPTEHLSQVVTSGEALWEDLIQRRLMIGGDVPRKLFPICAITADAHAWAAGNDAIQISDTLDDSIDVIMLMGLPDGAQEDAFDDVLSQAMNLKKPLICSNPDKKAPRASGLVISPGTLADRYAEMGGEVFWYGKPNANIYSAVQRRFHGVPANRFLMVGDSLEHDIAGAQAAGFKSVFVRGGLHAKDFDDVPARRKSPINTDFDDVPARRKSPSNADFDDEACISMVCDRLVAKIGVEAPDFCIEFLA